MNKKIIYISLQILTLLIVIFAGYFIFGKTKNKNLLMILDKVYIAYNDFVTDMGFSPTNIKDLYNNSTQNVQWAGPYISDKLLAEYSEGEIDIVRASHIPTKQCSLDSIVNCYSWIKVSNVSNNTYAQITQTLNTNTEIFYANDNLFFKITQVE